MGFKRAIAVWMAGSAFLLAATTIASAEGPQWTGFYVGGTVGSGWGESRFDTAGGTANPFDIDGTIAGVTIGYGFKVGKSWIAGIEGDVSSGISGSFGPGNLGLPNGAAFICSGPCSTDVDWFATVRARLGYTLSSALLVYGTAGFAFGEVDSGIAGAPSFKVRDTNTGWTAGAGIEYAFAPSWSMKLEYLHVDLGWTDRPFILKSDTEFDLVRVGVNFYFGK